MLFLFILVTGAILISLVIIYRWVDIINEQVKKIVGHTAPQDYIEKVTKTHVTFFYFFIVISE